MIRLLILWNNCKDKAKSIRLYVSKRDWLQVQYLEGTAPIRQYVNKSSVYLAEVQQEIIHNSHYQDIQLGYSEP
uniref:Uncharacterized protein n=1 Tax=Cucumis melo TaxID=3656 RepID=A0A9I9E5Q2_CUCME